MGNCFATKGEQTVSRDYLEAEHVFTETELDAIYCKICEGSSDPGHRLKRDALFEDLGLGSIEPALQERMVLAMTDGKDAAVLQFKDYLIARARLESGSGDEVEAFCHDVFSGLSDSHDKRRHPTLDDAREVLMCLQQFIHPEESGADQKYSERVVSALAASMPTTDGVVSPEDFAAFLAAAPAVKQLLRRIPCGASALPPWCRSPALFLLRPPETDGVPPVLREESAWLLAAELPPEFLGQWQLAYHSDAHGASIDAFMDAVADRGPSLLVVEDEDGAVFGGFAADAWTAHGQFYGNSGIASFVFSLQPAAAVFHSTGEGENFQWCCEASALSHNGVGMGGSESAHAFFIDETFSRGHSVPSRTFGNACLAGSEAFRVARVECWLVKPDIVTGAATVKLTDMLLDQHDQDYARLDASDGETSSYSHVPGPQTTLTV